MTTPSTLSVDDLRSVIATYGELLKTHRAVINRLNVYPVPDGDTGTNMSLTIEAVIGELKALNGDAELQRGRQGHRPRLVDGRAGQLGRDPFPTTARTR